MSPARVGIERQQRIERELSARVVALLEPIVGAGRVRVNVSAKLNSDTNEETEEHWDPTPVVRSQQTRHADRQRRRRRRAGHCRQPRQSAAGSVEA